MGLFHDTIRDARRPLSSAHTLRRQLADEIESESVTDNSPPSGMQTVFRFQQAASLAAATQGLASPREFREASIGPVEKVSLLVSDPLTAGEESSQPAFNVLKTDIDPGRGKRISNLVTGQEISKSRVTAANVVPVSEVLQSVHSSGFSEPDSLHGTQISEIQASSETTVSPRIEAPLSQPGRGASSEFFPVLAPAKGVTQAPSLDGVPSTDNPQQPAFTTGEPDARAAVLATPASLLPHTTGSALGLAGGRAQAPRTVDAAPANRSRSADAGITTGASVTTASGEPRLVIGRIDVTVIANSQATPATTPVPDHGFLSRNYLKRL